MTDLSMATAMPASTTEAAFAELYTGYRHRIEAYIAHHLPPQRRHLAEDITAETFTSVWVTLQNHPIHVDHAFAFLATVAKRRICDHQRRLSSHETTVDFTDPSGKPLTAPLADAPHLARLYDELEAAKDRLVTAAELYKAARKAQNTARIAIYGCHRPASVQRWTEAAHRAAVAVPATLAAFKAAADEVAARRHAWNTEANTLGNAGDSDPDMDEALRRTRVGAGR